MRSSLQVSLSDCGICCSSQTWVSFIIITENSALESLKDLTLNKKPVFQLFKTDECAWFVWISVLIAVELRYFKTILIFSLLHI